MVRACQRHESRSRVINIRVACDDANQTWFHTLNALRATIDEVKKVWPDVNECTLQSDGANNYDCTAFMVSAPRLFEAAMLRLLRHVITEVGDGKNLVDTDFQQAQMALNHGLDGGRDYEDAQGILDTLEANKTLGVVNVGMQLGARALEPKKGQGPKAYAGIDSFYDREYQYDAGGRLTGVCLRKFFGLGPGRVVTAAKLRALWRQDFDASQVDPERMVPSNSGRATEVKVKSSHQHKLQLFHQKRYAKQRRDACKAVEAAAAIAEELQYAVRTITSFSCRYASDGCRHRPFLTQSGADAHGNCCDFSGCGKRQVDECCVKARVRCRGQRGAVSGAVSLQLISSAGRIQCELFVRPLVSLRLRVLRPLVPDKPYGLQPHRSLVHHKTTQAQQCATQTVRFQSISVGLNVGRNQQGLSHVNIVFDLRSCKRPDIMVRGWAIRPPQEHRRFTLQQRSFLVQLYDWPHGRLNEHQAFAEFRKKFNATDGEYARSFRLSRAQIKAYFSTEKARRTKAGAAAVVGAAVDDAAPARVPPATAAPAAVLSIEVLDSLEVDDILDVRWRNGQREFLVLWEGFDEVDAM